MGASQFCKFIVCSAGVLIAAEGKQALQPVLLLQNWDAPA